MGASILSLLVYFLGRRGARARAGARAALDTGVSKMAATVRLGDAVYRVQSLSPTLLRIEGKGAEGFEDRSTFLVPNRARFPVRPFANVTHTSCGVGAGHELAVDIHLWVQP